MKRLVRNTLLATVSIGLLTACPADFKLSDLFDQGKIKNNQTNSNSDNSPTSIETPTATIDNSQESSTANTVSHEEINKLSEKVYTDTESNQQLQIDLDFTTEHASDTSKQKSSNEPKEWLAIHNRLRQRHNVGNLVWSDDIAKRAKAYAETCSAEHSDPTNPVYGENLAFATNKILSPTEVVNAWYDEIAMFDFDDPKYKAGIGHFTQVVWKDTTEVGCGYHTGCQGKWEEIWVCQYEKRGNIGGKFAHNVLPPIFDRKKPHEKSTPSVSSQNSTNKVKQANHIKPTNNVSEDPVVSGYTVEVIDGEKVIKGDGFTISKSVKEKSK